MAGSGPDARKHLDDIRAFATGLPEVDEKPHFGRPAFRVRDKLFVSVHVDEDDPFAIVHVDRADATAAVQRHPEALEEIWRTHGGKRIFVGLKVELSRITPKRCEALIEQAWRNKAPKRLVASHDAGR